MENEDMQEIFYLRIVTALQKELREKLSASKLQDSQINVLLKEKKSKVINDKDIKSVKENLNNKLTYDNYVIPQTFRWKWKLKRIIRHNKAIENKVKNGYFKGLNDAITIVNKVYKKLCKDFVKVDETK